MNYTNISDELLSGNYARFDTAQTTQAQHWVNHAYALLWAAAPWPWKLITGQNLVVTGNTRTTNLWPAGAMANLRLAFIQDDEGNPIEYLAPQEFFRTHGQAGTALSGESSGRPSQWTMIGDSVIWNTISDASYNFNATLERNIFIRTSAGAYKNGVFSTAAGTDVPAWNEPFHYAIVLGATLVGLAMENDPSAGFIGGLYGQAIEAMQQHYLPGALTTYQLARDSLS